MGAKYFGASVPRREDPRSCAARGASSTMSSFRGCCTRPSCGPLMRMRASPDQHRGGACCRAWRRVHVRRPRALDEAVAAVWGGAAGAGGGVPVDVRQVGSSRCVGTSRATWARSSPWCWRSSRARPRTPWSGSRSTTSRCRWWSTWSRPRSRAPVLHPEWGDNWPSLSRPASATRMPRCAEAAVRVRERFRSSATSACRSRPAASSPSGTARRHAHDLEQHPGLALRPAGPGRRPRPAAPQDPGDRARRRRRLRHQGHGYAEDLLVRPRRSRRAAR